MEGIGSEVSQKIRAAIKAKLIELGAYVDDELPDYIMVMVANKRTKSQMDEDLHLFLASNTKIFTSWLHTVLQKLQEVTVANFEGKKDSNEKKSSKKRKSEMDSKGKVRKSSEEDLIKMKKRSKKHKEEKKMKKNKHKSKDKIKFKSEENEKEELKNKSEKEANEVSTSQETRKDFENKTLKNKTILLNDVVGKAILGNLKLNKSGRSDKNASSSGTSSSSEISTGPREKLERQNNGDKQKMDDLIVDEEISNNEKAVQSEDGKIEKKTKELLVEDEFNIEPLKPNEENVEKCLNEREMNSAEGKVTLLDSGFQKTISVPTEKLLKEHNKLLKECISNEKTEGEKLKSESDDSVSPEEMRKQLLLSRAKKKLENSKLAQRMRSNSPDVLILDETNKTISRKICQTESRVGDSRSSPLHSELANKRSPCSSSKRRFSQSSTSSNDRKRSPCRKKATDYRSNESKIKNSFDKKEDREKTKNSSSLTNDRDTEKRQLLTDREQKKNLNKIPENQEKDRHWTTRRVPEKSKERQETTSKKKILSSRVVTITGPEAPEIPSIVKVKPREYIAKEKQANKALILKAVADAEKSIATIPMRTQPDPEPKKDALFTKNLRSKKYEKLAVTLSNIQNKQDFCESMNRRVSVDSDKSERSHTKLDSSEISEGARGKSDLLSRKKPRNDDQFISSKTTVMEKNEKYIRCWLEGVERAVKDEEIVNPDEMEELIIHSTFSVEENESLDNESMKNENEKKRKRLKQDETCVKNPKLREKELASLRMKENSKNDEGGPQIVVTLDGLDSKTVKDIIKRNKESIHSPVLSTRKDKDTKERVAKVNQRLSTGGREKSPTESKKTGFEKISDRFGRLNKANEDSDSEKEKSESKTLKTKTYGKEEASCTKNKNRELIAQLSEKFGKVDRKFENKKRRYPEEDRKYVYDSRRTERENNERNGKYKKSERRSNREGTPSSPPMNFPSASSAQTCKFSVNCKNIQCRYYHPKKCRFDQDCTNSDCKYIHSESSARKKSKWYAKT